MFKIEILNATLTPSTSNQLRNVKTKRWKYRNITIQPGGNDDRKSEDIAFFVNAGLSIAMITVNNFFTTKGTSSPILRRNEEDRVKWCAMKKWLMI